MKRIHLPLLSGAFILILSSFLSTTQAAEPFFNEKDFTGWSANEMSFWSVRNGEIVGTNGDQRVPGNQFLWYDEKVKNFHLSLQVKQVPFAGNGGIQFRSERQQNGSAVGYQADIGKGWWGSLYHEHGRKILAKNKLKESEYLKPEQWNSYEILAVGHRIWLAINGKITVAVRDPIGELDGQISLQIHGGIPQKIIYRKLRLTRNPKVEILGMKESELNALLALAPKGFVQPLNKSNK
jgi:hypothetical protein